MGFSFGAVTAGSLMGILNVTPDSFSEGGRDFAAEAAISHGIEMVEAGAAVLDVGGEATSFFRKGVEPVEAAEQLRRVLPVVRGLVRRCPGVVISVDTRSSEVAEACLGEAGAGAGIVNDISAGTHDERMLEVVARRRAAIILMHISPGYPATAATEADIVGTVRAYLAERVAAAERVGIARQRIAVDPGIGFGKSMADNWKLALRAGEIAPAGVAVVVGLSRKRFLETPPPRAWAGLRAPDDAGEHPRDGITAAVTAAIGERVCLHRVHHVALAARAMREAAAC